MKKSNKVALSSAFLALATTLTACASDDDSNYCGDEQGYVQSEDRCDGDGDSGTFIYVGTYPHYNTGDKIDSTKTSHKVLSSPQGAKQLGVIA